MADMPPSAVREILKVAERPDILSFAGGLPAPELFPVEEITAAHAEVLRHDGGGALQYSTTEVMRRCARGLPSTCEAAASRRAPRSCS